VLFVWFYVFTGWLEAIFVVSPKFFEFFVEKSLFFFSYRWVLVITLLITTSIIYWAGKFLRFLPNLTLCNKPGLCSWKTCSKTFNLLLRFNNFRSLIIDHMWFGHANNLSDHTGFNLLIASRKIELVNNWTRVLFKTWDGLRLLGSLLFSGVIGLRKLHDSVHRFFYHTTNTFLVNTLLNYIVNLKSEVLKFVC
jgi:hypothetical protein